MHACMHAYIAIAPLASLYVESTLALQIMHAGIYMIIT